jgi:hypothetical protein
VLPFLVLFHRRQDRRSWVAFGAVVLALCLMTGDAAGLPGRLMGNLDQITEYSKEGRVNDYSAAGPSHASLIGLDHAFYRLGLAGRGWIRAAQLAVLAVLGAGVARTVGSGRCSRGAACALVALYAAVFLYHRIYDMVLLVLPLVYAATPAGSESPRPGDRRPLAGCALAVLLVLFLYPEVLVLIERGRSGSGAWDHLIRAAALPGATWLILLAMALLWAGSVTREAPPAQWG